MASNKDKGFKAHEVIILVIITCVFSFFAGASFARMKNSGGKVIEIENDFSPALQNFINNYNNILKNYYEELDEEELLNAALQGMMELLDDPYSIYMDQDNYSNLNVTLEGSYEGLGLSIYKEKEDGNVIVSSVFESSPADEAGLKPGDEIISINGKKASEMTTSEFSGYVIRGDETKFKVEYSRNGKVKTVEIQKNNVTINSVESEIIEEKNKKIGYIYVSIFATNTYKQFKENLLKLEKEKIDSLIIDLRDNTGGRLSTVSKMIDLFVDSSYISYQVEQNGKVQKIYSEGEKTKKYPIVFITNKYSASASEVMVLSLKDNLNAKVVGEKSYGKGTVQEMITLSNGDKYKITTKKWLSPKGTWVNDTKGIEPDVEVQLSEEFYNNPTKENDNQLQAAIELLTK